MARRPCACARGTGFDPLRIRPYVTMPGPQPAPTAWPGPTEPSAPPQPVLGVLEHGTPAQDDPPHGIPAHEDLTHDIPADDPPTLETPAVGNQAADDPATGTPTYGTPEYGTPAVPPHEWPEQTVQLAPVPPRGRRRAARRSGVPLLAGVGAVVVVGAAAAAMALFPDSGKSDRALPDPSPSAPAVSVAPVGPTASATTDEATPSPSASRPASPNASRSASASASAAAKPAPTTSAPGQGRSKPPNQSQPSQATTLRRGDSGQQVKDLQQQLKELGYLRGRSDGMYDDSTERAVARFQYDAGVEEDPFGVYGPATRKALEEELSVWGN
ncbi:peptidoglycan-binding domain-containing protein [Streptomyces bambusae]|uniref:Peptidoglycan binding-like domain-containing protein n=1 Tax=Streptomyces bambusae TaxID=1550616 RepID=A0ABS6Z9K1_9ACTN|nr:peptidoglycan-binding domain-containing protein [Streptomyces bambusae]MBW5484433.1 hypothetical protein [Streptomyces bambusae]